MSKKVKLGIIGLGNMGSAHVDFVKNTSTAELVAVADHKKEKADQFAEKSGAKAFYDGLELIKSGLVEAVIIATPHYDHTPLAIAAFENGLHVLSEKPIAVHKADAQRKIDAHKKRPDLKFALMFQQRTDEAHKKIKSIISAGELGEIRRVNWIITTWFSTQYYYASGGWRATWSGEGGGVLLNECPHQLYLFQWFFGMPKKLTAYCQFGRFHNIEVEDNVTAYLEYPNGATGVFITTTGEAPGTNRLEVAGDRGRLVFEDGKISFRRSEKPVQEFSDTAKTSFNTPDMWDIQIPYPANTGAMHQKVIAAFSEAILNGTPLIADGEEGINSIELANAMLYSAWKGKAIELPIDSLDYETILKEKIAGSRYQKSVVEAAPSADFGKSFGK